MRLFVAVLPPREVLDEVGALVARHRASWPDLRWVRRELWHVTIAFFGEVEDRSAERLLPRLDRVAGRYPPLELSFSGAGAFARPTSARVLYTGVSGDRDTLVRLAESTEAAGRRAGAPGGGGRKRPHPHLTLARCRQPTDVRPLVKTLSGYAGPEWQATEIHLMRSHLGPDPRHESLRAWPLTGI